jgi:hypothetical protein
MGVFDVHCAYSGIALKGETQLILLSKEEDGWKVISAPLRGSYDRYGRIDIPSVAELPNGSVFAAFMEWASEHFGVTDSDGIFQSLIDREAVWRGREVSYALVDADVYDALPDTWIAADQCLPVRLQCPCKAALGCVTPIDIEDSDQYCGFEGKYGCRSRVELALQRFADAAGIVAAINHNATRWRALDG